MARTYGYAIAGGLIATFTISPALSALTVEIAPWHQLGNANALYGLATSVTRIASPALSGVLVAFAGPAVVVAADAVGGEQAQRADPGQHLRWYLLLQGGAEEGVG